MRSWHFIVFSGKYTFELPITVSRRYAYVEDLAIIHPVEIGKQWKETSAVAWRLQTWKLKLSTIKTMSAVFRLNNKEAKRELKVNFNNETLAFCSERQIPRSNVGQDAQASTTPSVTKKTEITRRTRRKIQFFTCPWTCRVLKECEF